LKGYVILTIFLYAHLYLRRGKENKIKGLKDTRINYRTLLLSFDGPPTRSRATFDINISVSLHRNMADVMKFCKFGYLILSVVVLRTVIGVKGDSHRIPLDYSKSCFIHV